MPKKNDDKKAAAGRKPVDRRIPMVVGLALLVFAAIMLVSFVSFLFTWRADSTVADQAFGAAGAAVPVAGSNVMGRVGVALAHTLMLQWVGVSAFLLIPAVAVIGVQFLGRKVRQLRYVLLRLLVAMLWLPLFIDTLADDKTRLLGGDYGYELSLVLTNYVGTLGAALVLILVAFAVLVFLFPAQYETAVDRAKRFVLYCEALRHKRELKRQAKAEARAEAKAQESAQATVAATEIDPAETEWQGNNTIIIEAPEPEPRVAYTEPQSDSGNVNHNITTHNPSKTSQQTAAKATGPTFTVERPADEETVDSNAARANNADEPECAPYEYVNATVADDNNDDAQPISPLMASQNMVTCSGGLLDDDSNETVQPSVDTLDTLDTVDTAAETTETAETESENSEATEPAAAAEQTEPQPQTAGTEPQHPEPDYTPEIVSEISDQEWDTLETSETGTDEPGVEIEPGNITGASNVPQERQTEPAEAMGNDIPSTPQQAKTQEENKSLQPISANAKESGAAFQVDHGVEEEQVRDNERRAKAARSAYKFPSLDLLPEIEKNADAVDASELQANKDRIERTLLDYGIEIDTIKATIGPTVTLYELVPAKGVRISKIKNLENDIALSLAALGIRIIAPMPGKGTIGIEVPNQHPEIVPMRAVLASKKFAESDFQLPVALGKTITNETFVFDLAKAPHMLVAGATGQGKSVGLNAILASLLYRKRPDELKLVLVDPKKVELTLYNKLRRHFLIALESNQHDPIITDVSKVVETMNSLCLEMDNRYDLLKKAEVRNIKEYNQKLAQGQLRESDGHRFLPYIVVVVDEYADLIMTAGKEIELPIARLAQLARAIGIHLIIATQRPTANIITGTIKANFPSRIAFRVMSGIDSKTILDAGGANQLIGRGDMLVTLGGEPVRVQCAYLDTPEVEAITTYIAYQPHNAKTDFLPLPERKEEAVSRIKDDKDSSPVSEIAAAARIVVATQQGSTTALQTNLNFGYVHAKRIMDQLERLGIVGPPDGSKARKVLVADMSILDILLDEAGIN